MDWLDNEIYKRCCSLFITDPAFMNEILSQPDYNIKNAYALDVDLEVDPNEKEWDANVIRELAKHFYDLGRTH